MRDRHRDAQCVGQFADSTGKSGRVQTAGVDDDPDAAIGCGTQTLFKLREESLGVAAVGALHPVPAQDEHGQFGQVIAGQIVQIAPGEHLLHGGKPVAVEP